MNPEKRALPLRDYLLPEARHSYAADLALLGARLYGGVTIAYAGLDKLPRPDWMVDQVVKIGWFPAPEFFATVACVTEFVSGAMLALGLFTRINATLLAFTLGVAAFGFHEMAPITGMHLTQGFFWLYVVLIAFGAGRISCDGLIRRLTSSESTSNSKAWFASIVLVLVIVGMGIYKQVALPELGGETVEQESTIESITVPGSFNDWELDAQVLTSTSDTEWSAELEISEAGPIEFKLAANGTWDLNYGDSDQDGAGMPVVGTLEQGADNLRAYIPKAGRYRLTVDSGTLEYRFEPVTP